MFRLELVKNKLPLRMFSPLTPGVKGTRVVFMRRSSMIMMALPVTTLSLYTTPPMASAMRMFFWSNTVIPFKNRASGKSATLKTWAGAARMSTLYTLDEPGEKVKVVTFRELVAM